MMKKAILGMIGILFLSSFNTNEDKKEVFNREKVDFIKEKQLVLKWPELIDSIWNHHPFAQTSEGLTFIKPHSDTLFQFDGIKVKPRYVLEHQSPLAPQSFYDDFKKNIPDLEEMTFGVLMSEVEAAHYFPGIT